MSENTSSPYKRLAKGKALFAFFSAQGGSLWLGPDHLLYSIRNRYAETFKRFYFRDIQAITVSRTENGVYYNVFLTLLILGMAAAAYFLFFPEHLSNQIIALTFFSLPILLLAINVAKGPTCRCRLYTAVHDEQIFALTRLKKAQKTLEIIHPLIEAEQGVLNETLIKETSETKRTIKLANKDILSGKNRLLNKYESGTFHLIFFLLLAVCGLSLLAYLWFENPIKVFVDIPLLLAAFVLGIKALRRQKLSFMTMPLRRITKFGLAALFALVPIVYNLYEIQLFSSYKPPKFGGVAEFQTISGPITYYAFAIFAVLFLLISSIGLLRLMEHRRKLAMLKVEIAQPEASA